MMKNGPGASTLLEAIRKGDSRMISFLVSELEIKVPVGALRESIGHPEIIPLLVKLGAALDSWALHAAISSGKLEAIDALYKEGVVLTSRAFETAICNGEWAIVSRMLKWDIGKFTDVGFDRLGLLAVDNGDLVALGVIANKGLPLSSRILDRAVSTGDLELCRAVLNCNVTRNLHSAVSLGNVDVLEIFLERGVVVLIVGECHISAMTRATESRNTRLVQVLYKLGIPLDLVDAVNAGNLDVVRFLVDQGQAVTSQAFAEAYKHEHLDIWSFLYETWKGSVEECPDDPLIKKEIVDEEKKEEVVE